MKLIILIIVSFCHIPYLCAATIQSYNFNFGSHTEFYNKVQSDASGGQRKFDFAPAIGVGARLQTGLEKLFIMPELNWVLPQTNEDSRIIKNTLMLRTDLVYDLVKWFKVRVGTSIMWLNQHGRGGKAQMNNGNSTSTFYYPDENRSSWNNTMDLGVEGVWDHYSLRLQTYTYSIFKSERQQISYTLFLTYHWDKTK